MGSRGAVPAAALAAALSVAVAACGKDDFEHRTLAYTEGPEEASIMGFADAPPQTRVGKEGPEQLSPGDGLSFGEDLFGPSSKKVGKLDGTCVVTRPGTFGTADAQCTATATVPGGTLVLSTGGKLAEDVSGAIVGGTGDYRGASGTFSDLHAEEGKPAVLKLDVTIPQRP